MPQSSSSSKSRLRLQVLGVPVDVVSEDDVLEFVTDRVQTRRPARIVTVNAEFVVKAQSDREFAEALKSADLATPDSGGVVWAVRRQGAHLKDRVGGSDLIWHISRQAAELGHRVFLLGAREGVAAQAAAELRRRYPGLQIVGTYSGSPSPDDEALITSLIERSQADILFVAFGAPQQDTWIARNLTQTGAAVAMGVGGSFDYVAGIARRAPLWMQRRGLDWLWRLVRQPWRWRRMLALPRFAWLVWRSQTPNGIEGAKSE